MVFRGEWALARLAGLAGWVERAGAGAGAGGPKTVVRVSLVRVCAEE